jgi:hypothetical protein
LLARLPGRPLREVYLRPGILGGGGGRGGVAMAKTDRLSVYNRAYGKQNAHVFAASIQLIISFQPVFSNRYPTKDFLLVLQFVLSTHTALNYPNLSVI